ncbi:MAG: T9SS type A sorting domain-containing protein [Candidatus Jorgensenbacteria bacterium]
MKRIWMWSILVVLTASMPQKVWTQAVATDITVSKNLLPDSLKGNVLSLFVDANGDILAAMSRKALLRSTDDGKTWKQIFKKDFLSNFGFDVIRDKKTNAILYGSGSGIFRSTDEGGNWDFVWSAGGGGCFLAKPDGSILGGMGWRITQSDDGGITWREIFYDSRNYFNVEELAMNPKTGSIFAGVADTIGLGVLRSTNDGKTWHQSNEGLGDLHVWAVAADSNGIVYAGVERKGLYRSTDDGDTWEKVPGFDASARNGTAIFVLKPNLMFVGFGWLGGGDPSGKGGVFKCDGKEWTQIVADSTLVMSLAVKGKSLLVGTWNAIYRVDGAIDTPTAVDDYPSSVPTAFVLSQNYPNPFNPSTTIEFSLPKRSDVSVTIWNTIGQKIETLVDGEMEPGTHRIVWDAGSFPSGVYFYQLKAGAFTETKWMVLVK